ncbi:hypothetical protein QB607_003256 [Clostridium botulinum]|nr:hypothetical protein [Clostridium botulinum]EKS4395928.1 hypothetical protein [Clostridium botulinum]
MAGKPKMKCKGQCKRELTVDKFYRSQSLKNEIFGGYCPYCKECLSELTYDKGIFDVEKLKFVLKTYLDKPFFNDIFQNVLMAETKNHLGIYIKQLNLRKKGKILTWKDGEREDIDSINGKENDNKKSKIDKKTREHIEIAKKDVIKLLGYDPFVNEPEEDKYKLYNSLIDYLDESTLEDSFKIPTVIQIVKTFNQVDKIDNALTEYMNDKSNIVNNASSINTLFGAKKNMLASILNMAKDNGISVNHSLNKSKGAGTLTGTIKKLQDLGFSEAEVNLFDIETCDGMQQVANASNKSISQQLMFDENDYTEMIKEQKILIEKFQSQADKLEEENRNLKVKLSQFKEGGS